MSRASAKWQTGRHWISQTQSLNRRLELGFFDHDARGRHIIVTQALEKVSRAWLHTHFPAQKHAARRHFSRRTHWLTSAGESGPSLRAAPPGTTVLHTCRPPANASVPHMWIRESCSENKQAAQIVVHHYFFVSLLFSFWTVALYQVIQEEASVREEVEAIGSLQLSVTICPPTEWAAGCSRRSRIVQYLARGRDLRPTQLHNWASQWLFSRSSREMALFPCGSDPQ